MKTSWLVGSSLICAGLIGCGGDSSSNPPPTLAVVSSDSTRVTGESTLVELSGVVGNEVHATLNGADVSAAFKVSPSGTYRALLTGLVAGTNALSVATRDSATVSIVLTDHSKSGPIFSGPQQQPFTCQTQALGLGPAVDVSCNAATIVAYVYRSSKSGTFVPFDPTAPKPADLAMTTTTEGATVPYIVRVETGTVNRAVYQIVMLHQPGTPVADPWTASVGWNGRMVYSFGGGCAAGYRQGTSTGGYDDVLLGDYPVSRGFAVVSSSLNVFGTDCDDVISAESMAMVKELFIKTYGPPAYTIGHGGSGGSMQQHMITVNYPGLLDGILPDTSFPDTLTFQAPLADCALIDHAFTGSTLPWTAGQKTAVSGAAVYEYCTNNGSTWVAGTLVPQNCDSSIPASKVYDPISNPRGTRCTLQDTLVNVFGVDATTGFARRTLDNVGVQYGLQALNAKTITVDQFIDLNQHVGGFDIDGNMIAQRTVGDTEAIRLAYQTGQLNPGTGELASVPIIDVRPYWDAGGNVHDAVRSRTMRARLLAANGTSANQVIVTAASLDPQQYIIDVTTPTSPFRAAMRAALDDMDGCLGKIHVDQSSATRAQKVLNNKPSTVADACFDIAGQKHSDTSYCDVQFPPFGNPRLAAGEPLRQDILKCQLKSISPTDYTQTFSAAQLQALTALFPGGVCDYSKPGVQQQPQAGTWLSFPSPGVFALPSGT